MSLTLALLLTPLTTFGQDVGSSHVYRSQYLELRQKTEALLSRVQGSAATPAQLGEEQFALLKLTHRLEEEAMREYHGAPPGNRRDRSLPLVAQGCQALAFTLTSIDNLLDTRDRSFLLLAKKGIGLMDQVQEFF